MRISDRVQRQTLCAAIPLSSPVKPSPSSVVAFIIKAGFGEIFKYHISFAPSFQYMVQASAFELLQ